MPEALCIENAYRLPNSKQVTSAYHWQYYRYSLVSNSSHIMRLTAYVKITYTGTRPMPSGDKLSQCTITFNSQNVMRYIFKIRLSGQTHTQNSRELFRNQPYLKRSKNESTKQMVWFHDISRATGKTCTRTRLAPIHQSRMEIMQFLLLSQSNVVSVLWWGYTPLNPSHKPRFTSDLPLFTHDRYG